MIKEDLINSIHVNDKENIILNLNKVWRDENLWDDCFEVILELFYSTDDNELLKQIDFIMYFILKKNTFDKALKIINHEKYTYTKIKSFSHIYNVIYHNNEISTQLYKSFIMNDAEKYSQELMQLLDSTTIEVSSLDLTIDEKMLILLYSPGTRMGLYGALQQMKEQLEEDETELLDLTNSVLQKLSDMDDETFEKLNLSLDL